MTTKVIVLPRPFVLNAIKPYTNKELAKIYSASERTFRREIAMIRHRLGDRHGHRWNVKQIEKIMEHFGRPYQITEYDM